MTDILKPTAQVDGQDPHPDTITTWRSVILLSGLFIFCVVISAVCEALQAFEVLGMPQTLTVVTNSANGLFIAILTAVGMEKFQKRG